MFMRTKSPPMEFLYKAPIYTISASEAQPSAIKIGKKPGTNARPVLHQRWCLKTVRSNRNFEYTSALTDQLTFSPNSFVYWLIAVRASCSTERLLMATGKGPLI
jgi:hypothetical protein